MVNNSGVTTVTTTGGTPVIIKTGEKLAVLLRHRRVVDGMRTSLLLDALRNWGRFIDQTRNRSFGASFDILPQRHALLQGNTVIRTKQGKEKWDNTYIIYI